MEMRSGELSNTCRTRYSARLRSVKSSTKETPWSRRSSKAAPPRSTGTRLLERFMASGRPDLCRSPFVSVVPFGGCQRRPAEATRNEIVAAVSHHMEKGFVGVENATFKIPHDDPDDVRVDQTADPGLPFLEIVVQTGVLQRDRRLRRQQFQYRDPGGREHVRCQVILEIKHPDQLGLLHQGQAEDRPGVLLADVPIRRERILRRGVIEDYGFPRPDHVMEYGFGKLGR